MNRKLISVVAILGLALSGCFSSSSSSNRSTAQVPLDPGAPSANVRVLHASANAPDVDIYIEDTRAISELGFSEATGFTQVPARALAVAIRVAGAAPDSEPVFSTTVTPAADASYTLVAYGLLGGEGDAAFDLLVIDDMLDTPAAGFARLFVLHAAPTVGPVDIYAAPGDTLGDPLIEGFVPRADSGDYLEIPSGTYRIRITPADSQTIAYDSGDITLENGQSYFVAALDRESGFSPASLVALLDDPAFAVFEDQRARVRAVHLAADAPEVEVLVNGAGTGVALEFADVSDYLTVLAGEYELGVALPGSVDPVGDTLNVEVEPGKAYSVLATGLVNASGAQAFQLRGIEDATVPAEGNEVLVRVVHAAPDAPNVDILANGAVLGGLENIPYFTVSDYLSVPAGSYDLAVNVTGTSTTALSLADTALEAGSIYTFIATGTLPAPLTGVPIID